MEDDDALSGIKFEGRELTLGEFRRHLELLSGSDYEHRWLDAGPSAKRKLVEDLAATVAEMVRRGVERGLTDGTMSPEAAVRLGQLHMNGHLDPVPPTTTAH